LLLFQEDHSVATEVLEMARVLSPSETSWRRLLWYVLAGSRGGPNRGRIVNLLREGPKNVNQLAEALDVHYRVAEHHIRALEKNHLVSPSGERYGRLYFLSQEMEAHLPIFDEIWVKIQPRGGEVKK
jgi:DNA-binding transcriptional ArsR family regulator